MADRWSSEQEAWRKLRLLLTVDALSKLVRLAIHLPVSVTGMLRLSWQTLRKKQTVVVVVLINQLGDIIAAEPAARHAAEQSGGRIVWLVATPYAAMVRHLPYVASVVSVSCPSEWILMRRLYDHLPGIRQCVLHIDGHPCNWFGLRVHNPTSFDINLDTYYLQGGLLSAFSRQGLGFDLNERPRLPAFKADLDECLVRQPELAELLAKPFAAVHFVSNDPERTITAAQAAACVRWLNMRGYRVLELGHVPVLPAGAGSLHLDPGNTLPGQLAVLAKAHVFVGIDSAFAHAANAYSVPAAILIGRCRNFQHHIPYSGPWREESGVRFIRTDQPVTTLGEAEIVYGLERAFPVTDTIPRSSVVKQDH